MRCPTCYRPMDALHRLLGRCLLPPLRPAQRRSQRGYVPPSRAHRLSRADWLASVQVTDEHKRAVHAERQRRYRVRKATA